VVNFTLHDDGIGGDLRAGDGFYYADMPPISKNGTYRWEITMSSPGGVAHTTRVGTSLPDSIPFTEEVDPNAFELVRNGQFMVTGCCTDESNTNLVKLKPEKRVNAFLQSGSDTDLFEIEATLAGRSYSLRLSSKDLGSFDRIEVYQPSNLSTPVYSVNVLNTGFGYVTVPLSAEFAKPGNIVAIIGTNSSGTNYSLVLLENPFAEFSVGRFEVATDWHSQHTTLALDANRKSEGNTSLVTPAGWKTIESRNISTSDFDVIGERMSVDCFRSREYAEPVLDRYAGTLALRAVFEQANSTWRADPVGSLFRKLEVLRVQGAVPREESSFGTASRCPFPDRAEYGGFSLDRQFAFCRKIDGQPRQSSGAGMPAGQRMRFVYADNVAC
jgi:hypothetical protein